MTRNAERHFAALAAAAFAALVLWQLSVHELWRDEWHSWLIARHSGSLADLFANKRYEGHPALWYLLLYGISRFTANPLAMQLLHAAIAVAGAWTVLRFAPFSRVERVLLCAGYFLLYEYTAISRNYGVALLLFWAFCACVSRRPRGLLPALLLGLAAWAHAFALMLSGLLAGWWLLRRDPACRPEGWRLAAAVLLLLAAFAGAAWNASPPADSGVGRWHAGWEAERGAKVLRALADTLLPLPPLRLVFWNHHVLDSLPGLKALAGLLLAALATFALAGRGGRLRTLAFWVAALAVLTAFWYLRHGGAYRHFGFLFVAFVLAAWLERSEGEPGAERWSRARRAAFAVLLALQVPGALSALTDDARYPFSTCGAAAEAIRSLKLDDLPLVGETDVATAGVAGALDRPIAFVRGRRTDGFVLFDRVRKRQPDDREIVAFARERAQLEGKDALLIMTRPLRQGRRGVRRLLSFPAGTVEDERYIVYRVPSHIPARLPRQSGRRESGSEGEDSGLPREEVP